jgi:hypothetical protein
VAGTGATYAVTVEDRVPVQEALAATAVTDLVPVEAPLTVYVPLPVPLTVPAGLAGLTLHV